MQPVAQEEQLAVGLVHQARVYMQEQKGRYECLEARYSRVHEGRYREMSYEALARMQVLAHLQALAHVEAVE